MLHFTDSDACHIANDTFRKLLELHSRLQFVIPGLYLQSEQPKYMHELGIINAVTSLRTQTQIFYNYLQQARLA